MRYVTAEPFILLYTIVFTMHTATLPQLLLVKTCIRQYNASVCANLDAASYKAQQNYAHKQSSIWMMILIGAGLLPSLFTTLILGPLSDKWGRKKTMLVPPVCLAVQSVVYFLNSVNISAHPAFLLFGAVVTACYGEFQGAVAVAYSYMADVTKRDSNRTMKMAIIEGMVFLSGAPAGIITGLILKQNIGFVMLFLTTASLNLINFLYVLAILPPVVPGDRRDSTSSESPIISDKNQWYDRDTSSISPSVAGDVSYEDKTEVEVAVFPDKLPDEPLDSLSTTTTDMHISVNPIVHIKQVITLVLNEKNRYSILPYIMAFGLSVMAFTGELYIMVLFIKHRPLNLSEEEVGYYVAAQAAIRGLGVILVSQITIRCCRLPDNVLVYVGLLSQCVNYVLIALSKTKLMLYLVTLTGVTMPLCTSSLRAIISKRVDSSMHGTVLAAIEAVDILGSLCSNIVVNLVYFDSVASHVGLSFYVLSSFAALSFILFFLTHMKDRSKNYMKI